VSSLLEAVVGMAPVAIAIFKGLALLGDAEIDIDSVGRASFLVRFGCLLSDGVVDF
jgi:hypothetical protein